MTARAVRVDLRQGDVAAIEVIEDGEHVRLAIHDEEHAGLALIAADLSHDERRKLVSALASMDVIHLRPL